MQQNGKNNETDYGAYTSPQPSFCPFPKIAALYTTHAAGCADRRKQGVFKKKD
jgi:hypothetical protein